MPEKERIYLGKSGFGYVDSPDPLRSYGTLRKVIKQLKKPKLRALLDKEMQRSDGGRRTIKTILVQRLNTLDREAGVHVTVAHCREQRKTFGLGPTWREARKWKKGK